MKTTRELEQMITIHTAGEGAYSHQVPVEVGESVWMHDGYQTGTIVVRCEHCFYFLDAGGHAFSAPQSSKACSLVRLSNCTTDDLEEPCALDLDTPDGLALIGHAVGADLSDYGEVLWSSDEDK